MEKVKTYESGVSSINFKEMVDYLEKGYCIDFACGFRTLHRGKDSHEFRTHVESWTGMFQNYWLKGHKESLIFKTFSPATNDYVRIIPPVKIHNNSTAKHLLTSEY